MPCWLTKNETSVDNIAAPNRIQEEYSKSVQAASLSGNGSFTNNNESPKPALDSINIALSRFSEFDS